MVTIDYAYLLERALTALADVALVEDMDQLTRRRRALRVYWQIRKELREAAEGDGLC